MSKTKPAENARLDLASHKPYAAAAGRFEQLKAELAAVMAQQDNAGKGDVRYESIAGDMLRGGQSVAELVRDDPSAKVIRKRIKVLEEAIHQQETVVRRERAAASKQLAHEHGLARKYRDLLAAVARKAQELREVIRAERAFAAQVEDAGLSWADIGGPHDLPFDLDLDHWRQQGRDMGFDL
jgi:hypothetical protein